MCSYHTVQFMQKGQEHAWM